MSLPFEPEPASIARGRWHRATLRVWDYGSLLPWLPTTLDEAALMDRPGLYRDHVFDFHDGIRLIVGTETYKVLGTLLHVSASAHPNTPIAEKWRRGKIDKDAMVKYVNERVAYLGGPPMSLYTVHVNPEFCVFHFTAPELPRELVAQLTRETN